MFARLPVPILLLPAALVGCASSQGGGQNTAGSGAPTRTTDGGRIDEHYDARNDRTLVRILPVVSRPGVHLVAGAEFDGRSPRQEPSRVLITIGWTGRAVRFAGCGMVRWRADQNTIDEIEVSRDAQIGDGISEFLSGTISFARAQALGAGRHVSAVVCGDELEIPDDELALLRELVRRVTPRLR